jgi:hypothetical protein
MEGNSVNEIKTESIEENVNVKNILFLILVKIL